MGYLSHHDPSLRLSPSEPLMSSSRSDESSPASKRRVLEQDSLVAAFGGCEEVDGCGAATVSTPESEQGRRSHGVLVAQNCGRGSSLAQNWRRVSSFAAQNWRRNSSAAALKCRRRHDLCVGLWCRRRLSDIWAAGKVCEFRDDTCSRR